MGHVKEHGSPFQGCLLFLKMSTLLALTVWVSCLIWTLKQCMQIPCVDISALPSVCSDLLVKWHQPEKKAFSHLGCASEASEAQENLWMLYHHLQMKMLLFLTHFDVICVSQSPQQHQVMASLVMPPSGCPQQASVLSHVQHTGTDLQSSKGWLEKRGYPES